MAPVSSEKDRWFLPPPEPVAPTPPVRGSAAHGLWHEHTVQRLHLELLQATQHHRMDGGQIVRELMAIRNSWDACLVDGRNLLLEDPFGRLLKLRDVRLGVDAVDSLYVLCKTRQDAVALMARHSGWRADTAELIPPDSTADVLGDDDESRWLVIMWWD